MDRSRQPMVITGTAVCCHLHQCMTAKVWSKGQLASVPVVVEPLGNLISIGKGSVTIEKSIEVLGVGELTIFGVELSHDGDCCPSRQGFVSCLGAEVLSPARRESVRLPCARAGRYPPLDGGIGAWAASRTSHTLRKW